MSQLFFVILSFVCVEGWTQCNLYPLSKADVDSNKNSGFNQQKQDWPWIPCSWRTAQWKIPLPKRGEKSPRYHLVHKKWPGVILERMEGASNIYAPFSKLHQQGKSRWHSYHVMYWFIISPVLTYLLGTVCHVLWPWCISTHPKTNNWPWKKTWEHTSLKTHFIFETYFMVIFQLIMLVYWTVRFNFRSRSFNFFMSM